LIVTDTSVLVDFLRGRASPAVDRLHQLEIDGTPYAVPAICAQEVIQGAASEREWTTLVRFFQSQQLAVPADAWATHLSAGRIFYDCRRRGLTIRSTIDCFIAQLVLERDDVLLHSDADYERIARVRPLQMLTE
jgi:predicted nucleic acid-binding protein